MSFQEQSRHGSERMEISISLLSFSLSLLHSPLFLSLYTGVPKGSGEAEKEGIVHSVPKFNMRESKKRGGRGAEGVFIYYQGSIIKQLSHSPLSSAAACYSLSLLTGSGRHLDD